VEYEEFMKWYRAQDAAVISSFAKKATINVPSGTEDGTTEKALAPSELSSLCDQLGVHINTTVRKRFFQHETAHGYITLAEFITYYGWATGKSNSADKAHWGHSKPSEDVVFNKVEKEAITNVPQLKEALGALFDKGVKAEGSEEEAFMAAWTTFCTDFSLSKLEPQKGAVGAVVEELQGRGRRTSSMGKATKEVALMVVQQGKEEKHQAEAPPSHDEPPDMRQRSSTTEFVV